VTVKDKVGRKRYILIEIDKEISKGKIRSIIEHKMDKEIGENRWRLINKEGKTIILRVDHKVADIVRKEMNGVNEGVEFKSIKTSGTIKSLKKIQMENE
jgi:RNase P/RNase MRP subunit POP5|tara:strand:- start:210 stop:506 length:297 start_codon:yes stop_codon:yes gene_type:complete